MGTIATTTQANPFDYPSQAYMDSDDDNGDLWCLVHASAGTFDLYRSADGGTTWTLRVALTRANVQEYSRIWITKDDGYLYWAYRTNESSQDRVYLRRVALLASGTMTWSAEVLLGSPSNGGVAGAYHQGLDMTVDRNGATNVTYVIVAAGTISGSNAGCTAYAGQVNASGTMSANNALISGTRVWLTSGSGRRHPAVDKTHIGDGHNKGSNAPHVFIAWGRTALHLVKLAYSSSKWIGPTSPTSIASGLTPSQDFTSARWDGERFIIAVPSPDEDDTVRVYQRDQANTTTTVLNTPAHPQGIVRNCAVNYNDVNRDMRVYAVGTSTNDLYYVDYVRASGTWSSWSLVTATDVLSVVNWGTKPSTYGTARYDLYIAHSGSPNTLTSYRQTVAYPPNTPTWNANSTPYASGGAANASAALLLDWDFTDADPADTQSAYALSRQIGAGALNYWRASDSTWQVAEVKNTSGTSQVSLASGWGTVGDATHTYKVKVWDSADTASSYSLGLTALPSSVANPTITAPLNASTVGQDSVTVTWTVSAQTAYRVRLKLTSGLVLLHDSGWVTSTGTSYAVPYTLLDNTGYTVELETKNSQGLVSATQTSAFTVDYVDPATPTLVVTALPASGVIRVAITNPAPSGGQPAVAYQDLYRRTVGDTSDGVRVASGLASGATYDDWRAAAATPLQYRAAVRGVNGTTGYSAWTS